MNLLEDKYGLLPISELEPDFLKTFNSSNTNLNYFFVNEAINFHESRIGYTTCVFHEDIPNQVIAYFTILNSSIAVNESEFFELGINTDSFIPNIPASLIGKFAIHREYENCGNGRNILNLAISSIVDESKIAATRLIVVDALKEVEGFYKKCGFIKSLKAETKARNYNSPTIKMYKDVLAVI